MLSFNQKRIGACVLLALGLFSVSNFYFEWGLFGRFGKHVMVGIFAAMFIYQVRIGPTLEEVEDYRAKQGRQVYAPWKLVLTILVVMLVVGGFEVVRFAKGMSVDWAEIAIMEALIAVAGLIAWSRVKQRMRRMEK